MDNMGGADMDPPVSGQDQVEGFCEYYTEYSGTIQCG
jgi:hypothetical protein